MFTDTTYSKGDGLLRAYALSQFSKQVQLCFTCDATFANTLRTNHQRKSTMTNDTAANNIYQDQEDTIAAISSGVVKSGIGVIRVSGPKSREITESIFTTKSGKPIRLTEPAHIYYGFIHNVSRETSDEVLVLNMPAPHSYTGEDTVEIDCHGGVLMMQRVLETVLDAGARNATPGEFTKRAFLNGRIDLSQAEAVADIINAGNDNAIRTSIAQLGGRLSDEIRAIRTEILEKTAFIEAALDDPEHYSLEGYGLELHGMVDDARERLDKLIASFERGRHINNGIETVIIGRPNAGKSSLMNLILNEERAIVTEIPGTTRDTISETATLKNVMLKLTDTAGLRESSDEIERIGIDKALHNADRAELILCVIDGSAGADAELNELVSLAESKDGRKIYIINKTDIADREKIDSIRRAIEEYGNGEKHCTIELSAKTGDGLDKLISEIESEFTLGEISYNDEIVVSSTRQLELIKKASDSLKELEMTMNAEMPEDLYSVDLMNAYAALGEILGEEVDEDLVNEIFSKFCMGK